MSSENPYRGKRVFVHGCADTINWLLDHGANVTVTGACDTALAKKIDEHCKRVARDGKAYEKMRARLAWAPKLDTNTVDVQHLFMSAWHKPIIGITGAHGKTMATVWAAHLIGDAIAAGHLSEHLFMAATGSRAKLAVIELRGSVPPAKHIQAVSTDGKRALDAAIEAARLAGVTDEQIQRRMASLPRVPFRQEIIRQTGKLTIVNDAMALSPERGTAALKTFGGPACICIAGGDGKSVYRDWAAEIKKSIRPTNLILLEGSATKQMRAALGAWGRGIRMYETLEDALYAARQRAAKFISATIVFSPAAQTSLGACFSALAKKN
jgi:UDP-N-acetylmuramoylalanine-D-glutamate ligase